MLFPTKGTEPGAFTCAPDMLTNYNMVLATHTVTSLTNGFAATKRRGQQFLQEPAVPVEYQFSGQGMGLKIRTHEHLR